MSIDFDKIQGRRRAVIPERCRHIESGDAVVCFECAVCGEGENAIVAKGDVFPLCRQFQHFKNLSLGGADPDATLAP